MPEPKPRPDFITIRLSDAALKALGEDAHASFSNAHAHYTFSGAEPVEVLRFPEWKMLHHDTLPDGTPLFQEAE